MAYQRLPEYQISFPLFKVSELWKFEMSSISVSTMKHIVQKGYFFSFQTEWKKWVIFDTMAYQKLPEYQISFALFKVSELWKFQMSSFCVSTDEAHSSKKDIFSLSKQNEKNELYLTQWHTKGFQNIKLVSLYSKSVSRENSKCLHLASVQVKHMVQKRQCSSLIRKEKKKSHIWYNGIPKASRISNWFVFIQSQWAAKILNVVILRQYRWNKLQVWPVFHYVFTLYWYKMKTFGIFLAHWL